MKELKRTEGRIKYLSALRREDGFLSSKGTEKNIDRFDYKNKMFCTINMYLKLKGKHSTGKIYETY